MKDPQAILLAEAGKTTSDQTILILTSLAPEDRRDREATVEELNWQRPPHTLALAPEAMPFAGQAFDQVTARHLSRSAVDLGALLGEISRILKPGGRLLLSDYLAPEERKRGVMGAARWLNAFCGLREQAPTGFVSRSAWNTHLYQAGFLLDDEAFNREPIIFDEWATQPGLSPANIIRLQAMIVQAPEPLRAFLTVEIGADRIAFSMVAAHFWARKRDSHLQ